MRHKSKKRISWLKALLIALVVVLLVRFFVFQSFDIRSTNMSETLLPGDLVLIDKLIYGTRMPNTLLFIPFTDRSELSSGKYYFKWPQLSYHRLNGLSTIKNNDIIAFNYPEESDIPVDKRVIYVKRAVGIPGDLLQVRNNLLFINKQEVNIKSLQYSYRVTSKTRNIDKFLIEKNHLQEGGHINQFGEYLLYMTPENADKLRNEKDILSVKRENQVYNIYSASFFPNSPYFKWTGDGFGPIKVPRKGDTIELGMNNIDLYKRIISTFERHKLAVLDNKILIDEKECSNYVFEMNYYFVMDDNRDNAKDSRKWGFLPEDHIIGKVTRVLFSLNKDLGKFSVRWERTNKKIN